MPEATRLDPSYPNPFNPVTTIKYQIAEPSRVRLVIHDILGREIGILDEGEKEAGYYQMIWDASERSSGIYYVRMVATNLSGGVSYQELQKLLLIK